MVNLRKKAISLMRSHVGCGHVVMTPHHVTLQGWRGQPVFDMHPQSDRLRTGKIGCNMLLG